MTDDFGAEMGVSNLENLYQECKFANIFLRTYTLANKSGK